MAEAASIRREDRTMAILRSGMAFFVPMAGTSPQKIKTRVKSPWEHAIMT